MPNAARAVIGLAVLILLAGCTESRRRDQCAEVANACAEAGESRCSRANDAIESCEPDPNGCLVWTLATTCGGPSTCIIEGVPVCDCNDECAGPDARCRGDVLESCRESDAGCWYWAAEQDCADLGQTCDDASGAPACASGCTDECDGGTRRCDGRTVQECEEAEDGCTHWYDFERCGDRFCVERDDDAFCEDTCADQCDFEGLTSCDGDLVVLCVADPAGCLLWQREDDCRERGLECLAEDGGARCECPVACAEGESRCSGDTVQGCILGEGGCWVWDDVADCAALGVPCDDSSGRAECRTGGGDACDDAMVLWELPAILTGGGFAGDFTDAQSFTDDSCQQRDDAPEAVFAIDVAEGGIIYMSERGDINVTFSVQAACDPAGACLYSIDRGESDGFYYAPETPGRYYVIAEAFEDVTSDYEIIVALLYPEDCGNGVDDDLNGRTDCDDPACFGDPAHCATETSCNDGEDNDADESADCDDADCASSPWCAPYQGVWELFGEGDLPDVAGHTVTFTPDPADANGYRWTATGGVAAFAVAPGSGAATATLTLGDDDVALWPLGPLGSFTFYGAAYDEVFVGSNGVVTFGEADTSWNDFLNNLFARPGVSGLRLDLNPSAGGTITVDETATALAVTYDAVPRYGSAETATFQIVLHADGRVAITYLDVSITEGLVGLSSGVGRGDYPDEVDLVEAPPEDCDDGADNDFDGALDCADPDCFGVAPCDVETLCDDGLDNDGDGDTDCEDTDCAGPACEPSRGYWERFTEGDPPDIEGRTITFTPDAANRQGFVWARSGVGGGGFPVEPGTGDSSSILALGNDDFEAVALTVMAGFDFYGVTYDEIFVSSNGYVTFGAGSASAENEPANHFSLPSVAGYRRDLYESDDDALTVDEFADHVAITWDNAEGYAGPNDFQIVLWSSGVIELHYVAIPVRFRVSGLLGISSGAGDGTWPAETNFVP